MSKYEKRPAGRALQGRAGPPASSSHGPILTLHRQTANVLTSCHLDCCWLLVSGMPGHGKYFVSQSPRFPSADTFFGSHTLRG